MEFYDCHAHQLGQQIGGLIIAVENNKVGDMNVYSNMELRNIKLPPSFFKVEYIKKNFQETSTDIVKYHPRYEGYTSIMIIEDIKVRNPKGVIIDTLNAPCWNIYDYWRIAKEFPNINFLFSHAGGYEISRFLEMCHFTKNVWIDFSYVQNYFGVIGNRPKYKLIEESMEYGICSDFKNKILFGTDYPEFQQVDDAEWYNQHNVMQLLNDNFIDFIRKIRAIKDESLD